MKNISKIKLQKCWKDEKCLDVKVCKKMLAEDLIPLSRCLTLGAAPPSTTPAPPTNIFLLHLLLRKFSGEKRSDYFFLFKLPEFLATPCRFSLTLEQLLAVSYKVKFCIIHD